MTSLLFYFADASRRRQEAQSLQAALQTRDLNRYTGRASVTLSCPVCYASAVLSSGDPVRMEHNTPRCGGTPFVRDVERRKA